IPPAMKRRLGRVARRLERLCEAQACLVPAGAGRDGPSKGPGRCAGPPLPQVPEPELEVSRSEVGMSQEQPAVEGDRSAPLFALRPRSAPGLQRECKLIHRAGIARRSFLRSRERREDDAPVPAPGGNPGEGKLALNVARLQPNKLLVRSPG